MIKRKRRKNPERLKNIPYEYYIPLDGLKEGYLYYTHGRNLNMAVYVGNGIFKASNYDTEYHYDLGHANATLKPVLELEKMPKDVNLKNYVKESWKKYWPQIWPIEEERKRELFERLDNDKKQKEKNFGLYEYYCKNCGNITRDKWYKCPNCGERSIFGNQLILKLKDNSLWYNFDTPYKEK